MIILYFYLLSSVHRLSLRYFLIKTDIISVARMEIYGLFYFYRKKCNFSLYLMIITHSNGRHAHTIHSGNKLSYCVEKDRLQ